MKLFASLSLVFAFVTGCRGGASESKSGTAVNAPNPGVPDCASRVVGTWRFALPAPYEHPVDVGVVINGLFELRYSLTREGTYIRWMPNEPSKTDRGAYRVTDSGICTVTLEEPTGEQRSVPSTFVMQEDGHMVGSGVMLQGPYVRTGEAPPSR